MSKPNVLEVLPKIVEYYKIDGNGVGGDYHIVFEDDNIKTSHIEYCLNTAKNRGDILGIEIGELLLKMSKSQRKRICNKYYSVFSPLKRM